MMLIQEMCIKTLGTQSGPYGVACILFVLMHHFRRIPNGWRAINEGLHPLGGMG